MRVKAFVQLLEQLKQLTPRQRDVLAHHTWATRTSLLRQGFLKQSPSLSTAHIARRKPTNWVNGGVARVCRAIAANPVAGRSTH